MVPEDASYLGLCRADAGQKFPDSTRGDAACRTDHLRQGLGAGRTASQPPTSHSLSTHSTPAKAKPQPSVTRMVYQNPRKVSGSLRSPDCPWRPTAYLDPPLQLLRSSFLPP